MPDPNGPVEAARRLTAAAENDTVYADVYLSRARDVLSGVLSRTQYDALRRIQHDIDQAVKQCRTATMLQDWTKVDALAAEVERLKQAAQEGAPLRDLGAQVYDPVGVPIDPFSPGFDFLARSSGDRAALRDEIVANLSALAKADAPNAAFYDGRRVYFAGLAIESRKADTGKPAKARTRAEVEQLAAQAAQRGDIAQLRVYAQEILELARTAPPPAVEQAAAKSTVAASAYRCPVDLAAPFPGDAAARGEKLGLVVARTEPAAEVASLMDFVAARIWQPDVVENAQNEGTLRTNAAVDELGLPEDVAQNIKVLVAQFLTNPFVNSGGARFFPRFGAETVLLEAFPEDADPPEGGGLLHALGLPKRRGLARLQVDDALLAHGNDVLERDLGLDRREFRLVCIPQDVYARYGRDRGWGRRQQWTHLDGYQVLRDGTLRALVGGDVRYGGVDDLVSLGLTDQRDSVIVRFAVIRRARHVARWL